MFGLAIVALAEGGLHNLQTVSIHLRFIHLSPTKESRAQFDAFFA